MKKDKGFTLVELLASIIVLALLIIIIVPITVNIISTAKKKALQSSVQGLIDAATNYYSINDGEINYTRFVFDENGKQINEPKLSFKGSLPGSGIVAINQHGDVSVCVTSSEFYAYKLAEEEEIHVVEANGDVVCKLPENSSDDFEVSIDGLVVSTGKVSKHNCESNSIPESLKYKEDILNGANPELYEGLIPVNISDDGTITVADIKNEWYSYKKHHWANAVIVNYRDTQVANRYFNGDMTIRKDIIGSEIQDDDIMQYYVWIPRYKYKLFNASLGTETSTAQNIEIIFEDKDSPKSNGSENGQYLTHPAFTFGETELNGFWISKFEVTSMPTSANYRVTSRPNMASQRSLTISVAFNHIREMDIKYAREYGLKSSEIDSHLIKNMEWGAMAYLTHSKYGRFDYTEDGTELSTTCSEGGGCEVWINCNNSYYTGCSCSAVSVGGSGTCNKWNSLLGKNASTTGNIYGIYDIVGGGYEYIMASMYNASNVFNAQNSGFTKAPDDKYIDMYDYSTEYMDWRRSKLGDAMGEVVTTLNNAQGFWYTDYSRLPYSGNYYILRGGYYGYGVQAGIFSSVYTAGSTDGSAAFRIVITAEDD